MKITRPEEVRLSNGIPVIFQHFDGAVAATYWWVRTGSADESPKEAGYAHFLEHMLFKDAAAKETGRASTGQMASAIESLGGDINAYTSFDQTVYHVTCAAHHWERVIDSFGQMAKPQRFLKEDFEREREVILEELRKNEDSPGRQIFQKLFSLTYKSHPYGRPVIGYVKTLKAARAATVEAYYRRRYVPSRMGLILVGPIEDSKGARKKQILKLLEKRFGRTVLAPKESPDALRQAETPLRSSPGVSLLPFDVKTPSLCLSFRVPGLLEQATPAVDLMGGILGMGELSRLYQKLFYETSIATEASAGVYVPADPGMFYAQAEFDTIDKVEKGSDLLFGELARFRDEGPTTEEIERVVTNAESERLYATQTADGMASRLGFLKFVLGDLDYDRRYIDELKSVDAAMLRETARTYLDPRRLSGVLMVPESEKGRSVDFIAQQAQKHLGQAPIVAAKSKPVLKHSGDLPTEYFTLPSGIRVAYLHRRQSHAFSIYATMLGGLRLEDGSHDWGTSNLMAQTWTKGTTSRDSRAIAAIAEGRAASIDGLSGRNTVGLQLTGLARDWKPLSELFSDVLINPTFPDAEVEHSKRVVEDSIRGIEDHSGQLCSKLFLETLFEHHPYGRFTTGSLDSIAGVKGERLKGYHRAWVRPERLSIAVSGNIDRKALDDWLAELSEQATAISTKYPARSQVASLPEEANLVAPRWVEKSLGREQMHLMVGSFGTTLNADDRHAVRLLGTLLSGQSGRLFVELREKKSLAYTVSPVSFEGIERGYVATYIACAPQKRDEAVGGIKTVLEKLGKAGPTPSEMNRAREFFLGRRAMDLQSDSSLASFLGLELVYEMPHISESELVKTIRGISPHQIRDACRKYLVEPFQVTAAVG